jgi:predicted RNase H-like HicB family nuclease
MVYIYTAVFEPKENGNGYYAKVPDVPGCVTTGKSLSDAIEQITDALNGCLVVAEDEGLNIAKPTPQSQLDIPEGGVYSLIKADTIAYRAATDTRSVRKNVSLPAWMVAMADKHNINCSQLLQDSLRNTFQAMSNPAFT